METSDVSYAIFMEDDCDLQTVNIGILLGQTLCLNFLMIGMLSN